MAKKKKDKLYIPEPFEPGNLVTYAQLEKILENYTPGGGGGGELTPATKSKLGGVIVGADLNVDANGKISVDKATQVEQDNTKPITAAAVYTEVGNIDALLQTI